MSLLTRPHAFERGDKLYITTPLTLGNPSEQQIEEYAFSSTVKRMAPNENIGWLQGRYVQSGQANLNNAMWLSDELALKALTPMLMPVTVMHDPRTAVGTIADCKLIDEERSRIDTMLAIWRHRFPDIWEEAAANIEDGSLMQSMECLSPWYTCSDCGQSWVKLQKGAERASWCEHLQTNSSHRILGDVCFTGTGLIFGTRGAKGAYAEAHLDHFQDEIAEYHNRAHIDSTYRPSERSARNMGLVQIEESELATLRQERNDARKGSEDSAEKVRDLTGKLEQAEAETAKEKARADKEETARKDLEEKAQSATLKDKRLGELGQGFLAKLGDFTRERLGELAATTSDEDWEIALKEREELAGVKRDAKKEGEKEGSATESASSNGGEGAAGSSFSDEEVAAFNAKGVSKTQQSAPPGTAGRALARSLSKARRPATTPESK